MILNHFNRDIIIPIPVMKKPILIKMAGKVKNSPSENTVSIIAVANGSEQARILTASSISNVLCLDPSWFCSKAEMDAMWANGQKLIALCGNTTKSIMAGKDNCGDQASTKQLNRKFIPDLTINKPEILLH